MGPMGTILIVFLLQCTYGEVTLTASLSSSSYYLTYKSKFLFGLLYLVYLCQLCTQVCEHLPM